MNYEQFKYFLDAYGANLRRWPVDARAAARALIVTDQAAAAALAEAERLDRTLDLYAMAEDPARARRLVARISARAASIPARRRLWGVGELNFGVLWPRAAALAFVMALGIVTGMFQTDITGTGEQISASNDVSLVRADDSSYDVAGL
jgi:ferric-dicitrate binding protein FerR (iron transport regulator)